VAAVDASIACEAKAIVCLTISGRSARLLSKWKPICPILAVTRSLTVARQLQLHHGVVPFYYDVSKPDESFASDVNQRFFWVMEKAKKLGMLEKDDKIIGVQGWQTGQGHTNTIRILLVQ
jgi:pyruvate kinase